MDKPQASDAQRPTPALLRKVNIKYGDLLAQAAKVGVLATLGNLSAALKEAVDLRKAASLEKLGYREKAWLLLHAAFFSAIHDLADAHAADFLNGKKDDLHIKAFVEDVFTKMETVFLKLDDSFFQRPWDIDLVSNTKGALHAWLLQEGVDDAAAAPEIPMPTGPAWPFHPCHFGGFRYNLTRGNPTGPAWS